MQRISVAYILGLLVSTGTTHDAVFIRRNQNTD